MRKGRACAFAPPYNVQGWVAFRLNWPPSARARLCRKARRSG